MRIFDRTDRSLIGVWWWTVDHKLLGMLILLIFGGIMLLMSAGPPVAIKLKLNQDYFLNKQLIYIGISIPTMLIISFLETTQIRRLAMFGFLLCVFGMLYANAYGEVTKGATRWIQILGLSIQPSEFIKPFFAVFNAWLLSLWIKEKSFPGWFYSILLMVLTIAILILQPDIGMSFIIASTWIFQLFISGISLFLISIISIIALIFGLMCFLLNDHVQSRVEMFFNGGGLQITKSIKAFVNGGFFGQGFGGGIVSNHLPDSHSDFIFAVAGEEIGIIGCTIIIIAFVLIFWRGIILSSTSNSIFVILTSSALVFQFCLQAVIHMSSNLNMIPTKGMTLPFISYGGSSLLSSSITMGIVLAMTRRNYHWSNNQ